MRISNVNTSYVSLKSCVFCLLVLVSLVALSWSLWLTSLLQSTTCRSGGAGGGGGSGGTVGRVGTIGRRQLPEAEAALSPFGHRGTWLVFQISSQWETRKNRFAFISFGKVLFWPPCVWYQLFMATGSGFGISSSSTDTQAAQACCIATEHIWNNSVVWLEISNSCKKLKVCD